MYIMLSKPQAIMPSIIYLGFIFLSINSINELNKVLIKTENLTWNYFPIIMFNISILTFSGINIIRTISYINQLYQI